MPNSMDRTLAPPSTLRRYRPYIVGLAGIVVVVLVVASLPVLFLYFSGAGKSAQLPGEDAAVISITPAKDPLVAFVNVTVIPMDSERTLPAQTVIIENGRITTMGPASEIKVPAKALRVDATGKFLVPGFADLHVHLQDRAAENLPLLQLFAVTGVTTVLNLQGVPDHLDLRASIARGQIFGPTIFTSGPYIADNNAPATSPAEVEAAVIAQKRAGYDFIKIHGDFSREAYHRLFEVARREGIRVVGHSPRNLGYEVMSEEKQDCVAHAEEYIYDRKSSSRDFAAIVPKIPAIAQATARAGTALIPNLNFYKGIAQQSENIGAVLRRPEVQYVPAFISRYWQPETNSYVRRFPPSAAPGFFDRFHVLEKLTKAMQDSGVRILTGTDTPAPCAVPGFSLHDELQDLVAAGLTPYQSLRAATANPAEFLVGKNADFGTIAAGKQADLVLLDANPLENISNTRKIAGVMLHGQWLPAARLQSILQSLANHPEP